jgi:hypothetical protein
MNQKMSTPFEKGGEKAQRSSLSLGLQGAASLFPKVYFAINFSSPCFVLPS